VLTFNINSIILRIIKFLEDYMLSSFISDVLELLKSVADKIFIGALYGAGGLLGVHIMGLLLTKLGFGQ
jgi:hypothetical protein